MNRKVAIRLDGLVSAVFGRVPTEFDGQYVVEYDPSRPGKSPSGQPLIAHLVVTPDIHKALHLDFADACLLWQKSYGLRDDGEPNRPLTAFSVEYVPIPVEDEGDHV